MDQMNAITLRAGAPGPVLSEIPVPKPGPGEVLIRVAAAPINPSDLGFIDRAAAASSAQPVVPGLEGSGTVVAAGGGVLPRLLVGRRVAFAAPQGGSWAEYAVCGAMGCIPLLRRVPLADAAMMIVNPLTAMAFIEMARRGGHKAIVSNAAGSALGRMIVRLGRRHGIRVINIVRRPEHVSELREMNADAVLDSRDPEFAAAIRELAERWRATLVLDAVGGAQAQLLIDAVPRRSTIVAYAALSGEASAFNARTLIAEEKTVTGFYLAHWLAGQSLPAKVKTILRVQALILTDLRTDACRRVPLSSAVEAVESYRAHMSGGKVLLVADPGQVPLA